MSDHWDFYFTRVDDAPASIFVDLGIAAADPARPVFGYIRLHMRWPRDDGFSSQEEFPVLSALEDALTPDVARDGDARYVGRNTSAGCRDFYFFASNAERFTRAAQQAVAAFPDYRCDIGAQEDPAWSTYFDFLRPSLAQREQMKNRQVLMALRERGDDHEVPRPIDHRAYFAGADGAAAFADAIGRDGFTVQPPIRIDNGQFAVDFARSDRPAEIDAITPDILAQVSEFGGGYDGWGCEVRPTAN